MYGVYLNLMQIERSPEPLPNPDTKTFSYRRALIAGRHFTHVGNCAIDKQFPLPNKAVVNGPPRLIQLPISENMAMRTSLSISRKFLHPRRGFSSSRPANADVTHAVNTSP